MKRFLIAITAAFLLAGPTLAQAAEAGNAQPALTRREAVALTQALAKSSGGSLTVACGGPWCMSLAADLEKLFAQSGWDVGKIHHGGIGIDGVSGIRVESCGFRENAIRDVITQATTRKVAIVDDGPCGKASDHNIYVILGVSD